MMNLKEQKEFDKLKDEWGLINTLDEYDSVFYFRNAILKNGFVPRELSIFLSNLVLNNYNGFMGHLHSIILPSQGNMFNLKESEFFYQEEKEEVGNLIKKTMKIVSHRYMILLSKDKNEESKFFKESYEFWVNEFSPATLKIMTKINFGWENETKLSNDKDVGPKNSFIG